MKDGKTRLRLDGSNLNKIYTSLEIMRQGLKKVTENDPADDFIWLWEQSPQNTNPSKNR